MSVSYDLFAGAFLDKITDYNFVEMDGQIKRELIDQYMKRSITQFNKVCEYDLSDRNDEERIFNADIPEYDIDEIADIVSEGMVMNWLKPYTYKSENLENVLNTRDFSSYSPAELLLRISNTYKMVKRDFKNMCLEYSYNHGDLTALHL